MRGLFTNLLLDGLFGVVFLFGEGLDNEDVVDETGESLAVLDETASSSSFSSLK